MFFFQEQLLQILNKLWIITAPLGQGSEVGFGEGSWAQISSLEMDKLQSDFMDNSHMNILTSFV